MLYAAFNPHWFVYTVNFDNLIDAKRDDDDVLSDHTSFLAQHFLARFSRNLHPPRAPVELSQEATRQLMAYDWPGNVRQLENLVERMLTFSQGRSQIKVADLPPEVRTATNPVVNMQVKFPDDGIDFRRYVHDVEREIIRQALQKSGGNKRQAADLLLLKRTTLIEKIKRLQA